MTDMILRYEIPIDDRWHTLDVCGSPLYVACRRDDAVEFWARGSAGSTAKRAFRVFGTGQEIPAEAHYRGTAFSPFKELGPFSMPAGKFVWHLLESFDVAPEVG